MRALCRKQARSPSRETRLPRTCMLEIRTDFRGAWAETLAGLKENSWSKVTCCSSAGWIKSSREIGSSSAHEFATRCRNVYE
eukprot:2785475-Rhodomonas_salina.2